MSIHSTQQHYCCVAAAAAAAADTFGGKTRMRWQLSAARNKIHSSVFPFFSSHEVFPYFRGEKKREESSTSGPPPTTFFPYLPKGTTLVILFFLERFSFFLSSEALKMSVTLFCASRLRCRVASKLFFCEKEGANPQHALTNIGQGLIRPHTHFFAAAVALIFCENTVLFQKNVFFASAPFLCFVPKVCKAPDKETSQLSYDKRRLTTWIRLLQEKSPLREGEKIGG